ncbi:UNVERIFIED_CONTAM: hypothetical protein FKN15_066425 [Acipenser sinensis]
MAEITPLPLALEMAAMATLPLVLEMAAMAPLPLALETAAMAPLPLALEVTEMAPSLCHWTQQRDPSHICSQAPSASPRSPLRRGDQSASEYAEAAPAPFPRMVVVEVKPAGILPLLEESWAVDARPPPSWAVDGPTSHPLVPAMGHPPPTWVQNIQAPPSPAMEGVGRVLHARPHQRRSTIPHLSGRDGVSVDNPAGTDWINLTMCVKSKHVSYDLGVLWVISKEDNILACRYRNSNTPTYCIV